MLKNIRSDISLQLLALYLLFVGPVVIASILLDQVASRRLEADVRASDLALARAIALETNAAIDSSLYAVRQLANDPAVIQSDPIGMETRFKSLMDTRPDTNLIYRLDRQGIMVYHYPPGPGSTVGVDFSYRDYYLRALDSQVPLFSQGRISPTTDQPVASAVMPVRNSSGEFLGVVATNIKLQTLSHVLARIIEGQPINDALLIIIVDSAGSVIAHPDPRKLLHKLSDDIPGITQAVLSGQSGNEIVTGVEQQEILYSYASIPSAGWGVIISRPTATAFATLEATHRGVLISIAVFLVFGLLFWVALSKSVIRPLEQLSQFSHAIGSDHAITAEKRQVIQAGAARPDQIGRLSDSLIRMEASINARLRELSTLLQTGAAVVSTLDAKIVLDRILEQVERLMDVKMSAIIALDVEKNAFRVQASRGLSRNYSEQLTIAVNDPNSVTLRAIHSSEPIQISDTEEDFSYSSYRPRARAEGYRSILAVPLKSQHAAPAALLVYRPEPHIFSQREINLLSNFANQATMAIENATLFASSDLRLQEQTRRLEALVQSLHDGLILEDHQMKILYANRRISEMANLPVEDILGNSADKIIHRILTNGEASSETSERIQALRVGSGEQSAQIELKHLGQTSFWKVSSFNVTDLSYTHIGRGVIWQDISQSKQLDRMKSSLIATVSHELRTPLASIKGYTSTLLAEDVQWDIQAQREFLQVVSDEADRLSELVNDLLDMSRIEAGSLVVQREPCNLLDLIHHSAQRSNPPPGERLMIALPSDPVEFPADPRRMEVVLRNLIENASKYSPPTSPIRISAQVLPDTLVIRVDDEGPGISTDHGPFVFESFYRIENNLNHSKPGAGLGLSIARGFVRAHGGDIWLEPKTCGTCVAFSIPIYEEKAPNE